MRETEGYQKKNEKTCYRRRYSKAMKTAGGSVKVAGNAG